MNSAEHMGEAEGYRRWSFDSYAEYLAYQSGRAKRTKRVTLRYGAYRQRLIELVRELQPDVRTVLAVGARNPREVQDLLDAGFEAEGIDLAEDRFIRRCDMSDLDGSPYFRDRSYDAFLFVHSLEHCLDFPGFCARSLPHCRSLIAVAIPQRDEIATSRWDCVAYDFLHSGASAEAFERLFVGFELLHRETVNRTLLFVMRRKLPVTKEQQPLKRRIRANSCFINLLVANRLLTRGGARNDLERMLRAQIENSLEVGWQASETLLVTNFPFAHAGITATVLDLNRHCPRGSKMFAVEHLLRSGLNENAIVWAHDLDCWQNVWFEPPDFLDVGACEYSRPTFNGGSVFWRPRALDIAAEVVRQINAERADREEPTINLVLRDELYRHRVTILDPTYNVGCSGFRERWERSDKPVRVCHFHPSNRLAWATHVLNRHSMPERSASMRLEQLLRRWYPGLATHFSVGDQNSFKERLHGSKTAKPQS